MSTIASPSQTEHDQRTPASRDPVDIMGLEVAPITEPEVSQIILDEIASGRGGVVVTVNLDHLRRVVQIPAYRELVSRADLVVADGQPLVWASMIQGTPLPERVAGSDLVSSLSAAAGGAGRSVYLLGGNPGAAEGAAEVMRERFDGLTVSGWDCPPMGFEKDEQAMRAIRDKLVEASPDIVYVALGSPKQEELIDRLRSDLPGAWWMGVGISFSFLTGEVERAPMWIRKLGMEWFHRMMQEPGRLFRRYMIDGLPFAVHLGCSALLRRMSGKKRGA